jgi:hypothetical protein
MGQTHQVDMDNHNWNVQHLIDSSFMEIVYDLEGHFKALPKGNKYQTH